ncbi:DUF6153 family protein [Streptomyces sp. NPDC015131]|uniref:DUF6153 family protein n=1 Tax=Streptomyces sp. NPDC015131 TaxID=3364941 RepID=UPI0037032A0A
MSPHQHRTRVRPSAYRRALLVLAVLAGVLAMHGLAPGPVTTAAHHAHQRPGAHAPGDACVHAGHGDGGATGHAEHADSTCAAGGISTAPAPAPLLPGAVEPGAGSPHPAGPDGRAATGRGPPDLAMLQLLRI